MFQVAGVKRWKTYEPFLVEFPRPDLVERPSLDFLVHNRQSAEEYEERRRGAATGSPSRQLPPPAEFPLRAGDMLYVPRGMVHEATTAQEDFSGLSEEAATAYKFPSMHLTFGIEVSKGYTVEVGR